MEPRKVSLPLQRNAQPQAPDPGFLRCSSDEETLAEGSLDALEISARGRVGHDMNVADRHFKQRFLHHRYRVF